MGLGLVTDGLYSSTQKALTAGAADFSVVNGTTEGNGGPGGGFGNEQHISQSTVNDIQQISGVASATGVLRTMTDLNDTSSSETTSSSTGSTSASSVNGTSGGSDNVNSGNGMSRGNFRAMTTVIGINSADISMDDMVITNGTVFSGADEVIVGSRAAQSSNKTVGDTITISNQTFKIVGIYETGNFMDDRGIAMSLDSLQSLTGNTGQVSLILVKAKNGTNPTDLANTIKEKYSNQLTTSTSLAGMNRMNNGLEVISSGAWAVSLLAILVGAIIVVVTMMKAVTERTREIGVLRAIGWTKKRIMLMILGESVILSLVAIVVGLVLGIGLVEILTSANVLRGVVPTFSALLVLKGIAVALFLGIIGGIYPAYRASRLAPTEALRYE